MPASAGLLTFSDIFYITLVSKTLGETPRILRVRLHCHHVWKEGKSAVLSSVVRGVTASRSADGVVAVDRSPAGLVASLRSFRVDGMD